MKARMSENERMSDSGPQVAEGVAVCECGCQREPERSRERARGPVDGEAIEERESAHARVRMFRCSSLLVVACVLGD